VTRSGAASSSSAAFACLDGRDKPGHDD